MNACTIISFCCVKNIETELRLKNPVFRIMKNWGLFVHLCGLDERCSSRSSNAAATVDLCSNIGDSTFQTSSPMDRLIQQTNNQRVKSESE